MEKALRFNPLDDSMEFSIVETDFETVDEFYVAAKPHGPYLKGEVWKDTPHNRQVIERLILTKKSRKEANDKYTQQLYRIMNEREI